jgi:hypothetical protein
MKAAEEITKHTKYTKEDQSRKEEPSGVLPA